MTTEAATDLRAVEMLAHSMRQRLDAAAQLVAEHDAEVALIRDKYAPRVRRFAAEIAGAKRALTAAIEAARGLFLHPRAKSKTEVLHGIQVGYKSAGGKWVWPDEATLVARVKERLPERAADLIRTTETVLVSTLTEAERQVLGIHYDPPRDVVVVAEKGGSVEKAMEALVRSLPKEPQP